MGEALNWTDTMFVRFAHRFACLQGLILQVLADELNMTQV